MFAGNQGVSCRFNNSLTCLLPSVDPSGRRVLVDNSVLPDELRQQHPNPPHGPSCYTLSECSGAFRIRVFLHVKCRCRTTKSHSLSPLSCEPKIPAGSPRLRYPSHKSDLCLQPNTACPNTPPHLSSSRVCATRRVEASRRVQKKHVCVCCCKSGSAKIQRVGLMCRGACLLLQCANKTSKGVHEAHEGAERCLMRVQIDPERLNRRNGPG